MKKILILCLLAACFAMAAKKNVAVFPCWGDLDDGELRKLQFKIQEIGQEVLSKSDGFAFKSSADVEKSTDKNKDVIFNACSDKGGGTCLAKLTKDARADFGTWCQVDKSGNEYALFFQLFDNEEKKPLYTKMFDHLRNADDVLGRINKEIPTAFREMLKDFAKACKAKGKSWIWEDDECKSDEETRIDDCKKRGNKYKWRDGECKSEKQINCEADKMIWIGGPGDVCKLKEQIDCEKKDGRWENGICKKEQAATVAAAAPPPPPQKPQYTSPSEPEYTYTPPAQRYVAPAKPENTQRNKVRALIKDGLKKNKDVIQKESSSLLRADKDDLYDDNKIESAFGWAMLNLWSGFGLGSYIQGNIMSGLAQTSLLLGGAAIAMSVNTSVGIVVVISSYVYGIRSPYAYRSSYNESLKKALNFNDNVSYSIEPLIVPKDNGMPAVGLAFNMRY